MFSVFQLRISINGTRDSKKLRSGPSAVFWIEIAVEMRNLYNCFDFSIL